MCAKPLDEEAIFKVAADIPSEDVCRDYLQQVCGGDDALRNRVLRLLRAHDEAASFLESPPPGIAATIDFPPVLERPGQTIGRYKLLEEIGEGGMGVVFMAEQREPVRRKVALKIIKPGMDTREVVARFEAERQALAMMDHVNIAHILDGGATESGRPYFVMERIVGLPITEYCDRANLTTRERLALFVSVCQAVQHAHQKGIIHRDLKPSNVLVTLYDGVPVPKIIDFGVAKAIHQPLGETSLFTGHGRMVGTPLYMSPEQAEMSGLDVDTNGVQDVFVYDRQTDTTERVSVASDGAQGNGEAVGAEISADGHYVAFWSSSTNLVPGDTNGQIDSFVYDRQSHAIARVSLASDGTEGNGQSTVGKMSADGRYVAFMSYASNLVPGDTNGHPDAFVYDRQMQTIERVSLASDGAQANSMVIPSSISADGRYVGVYSMATNLVPDDTNGVKYDSFVYDRQTDTIKLVSVAADGTQGNGFSEIACLSADGRHVAFNSGASNLVPGDTNSKDDVFVTANPFSPVPGSQVVTVADGQVVSGINSGNNSLATKFYVVNDAAVDRTYEYNATGTAIETYGLNTGNTAPRGAASTTAGDETWVVDANRKVYVYSTSGGLLGSWTAGTLASNATVEGIATNGTDVWIVDAKSDKVYKYTGAATRLSGSQNAASSFSLNSSNSNPKDIVTDGVNFWVVNDSTTDKVFKYTISGALVSSWTITTPGATSPTGITIDPANVSNIWIVDSGTDAVYLYRAATSLPNGSSRGTNVSFALAAGNTNPQGIADPPAPGSMVAVPSRASSASASQALDAALVSLMNGQAKAASAKPTGTVLAKATVDAIVATAVPQANTPVTAPAGSAKLQVKAVSRRGPAIRAVDHAMTAFAGGDLKIESALQSLAGSRA